MSRYYYMQQRQEDLDSLQSMFERPWTRDLLDAVLEYHSGNVDDAISSLLVMNEHHNGNPEPLVQRLLLSDANEPKKKMSASSLKPAVPPAKSAIPKSLMKKPPPPRKSQVPIHIDGSDTPAIITIEKSTRRRVGYHMKLPDDFLRIPKNWNAKKQARSKMGPLFAPNHLDHLMDMPPPEPLHQSPRGEGETAEAEDPPPSHFKLLRANITLPNFRKNNGEEKTDQEPRQMLGKLSAPNFSVPTLNMPKIQMPSVTQARINRDDAGLQTEESATGNKRWSLPNLAKNNSDVNEANKMSATSRTRPSPPVSAFTKPLTSVSTPNQQTSTPEKRGSRWSLNSIGANLKTPPSLLKMTNSQESSEKNSPDEQAKRWSLPNISTTFKSPPTLLKSITASQAIAPLVIRDGSYHPIPLAEYRGITIRQLQSLVHDMCNECNTEQWKSAVSGATLRPEQVTMYDLVKHYILPKTQTHHCSFVEVAFGKYHRENWTTSTPQWFVSHTWGDSVVHVLHCMEQHAADRGLDADTSLYWICAFAMSQHTSSSTTTADGMETSDQSLQDPWTTQKILKNTLGMLTVVDSDKAYYSRVWCIWEVFLALQRRNGKGEKGNAGNYLYDVYATNEGGKAAGLTDGPVESDKYRMPKREVNNSTSPPANSKMGTTPLGRKQPCNPMEWSEHRALRQFQFPLESCICALDVNVESAQASLKGDISRVLNCIIQYDKDDIHGFTMHQAEALTEHPAYTKLNKLIHGTFAAMAYRHVVERAVGEPGGDGKLQLLDKVRTALSTAPLEHLEVTFAGCVGFQIREALKFAESLPTTLRSIELDYSFLGFQYSEEFAIGFGRLGANLEAFKFSCAFCPNLGNLDRLWEELGKLVNLRHLVLVIHPNKNLTSVDGLTKAIRNMTELRTLELEFDCFGNYSKFVAMAKGGATLNNFRGIMNKSTDSSHGTRELSQQFDKVSKLANLDLTGSYISEASILGLVRTLTARIHDAKLTSLKLRFLGDIGKKLKNVKTMDDLLQTLYRIDQGNAGGLQLF